MSLLEALARIRRTLQTVARAMNRAAGWGFVVCSLLITFDVLGRKFLGFSTQATVELTGYLLAFGIAFGLAHALAERCHIRIDVLVMRLPLGLRQYLHLTAAAMLVTLLAVLAWAAWSLVEESHLFNAHDTSVIAVPMVLPQGAWALGIAVMALFALSVTLEAAARAASGDAAGVDRLLGSRSLEDEAKEALDAAALSAKTPT
jgi:TRAP-type C4-dicarboxylate transport system permease small subunit